MLKFSFWLLGIVFVIYLVILVFNILTRKYVSPYTFTLVFGKKGSGKSCTMQKDLIKHYKKGWSCYADSNTDLPFVEKIDCSKIWQYNFPRNSLICIDEVNLLWDNRDFKNFPKPAQAFFRQQRKLGIKIIAYSQTFDTDKKLRDLCDTLAIQSKYFRVFSFRRLYYKVPVICPVSEYRDNGCAGDDYKAYSILFGHGLQWTFIPKYVKKYDTNEIKKIDTNT